MASGEDPPSDVDGKTVFSTGSTVAKAAIFVVGVLCFSAFCVSGGKRGFDTTFATFSLLTVPELSVRTWLVRVDIEAGTFGIAGSVFGFLAGFGG